MGYITKSIQITLFVFICFVNTSFQHHIKKLDLYEGDICKRGEGSEPDYVCMCTENCNFSEPSFRKKKYPDICSFDKSKPIICCPPMVIKTPFENEDSDTDFIGIDIGTDTDYIGIDIGTDTDFIGIDIGTDTGKDTYTGINRDKDTDTFIYIGKDTDTGINAGTDTDTDKDSDTGKDTDIGINAGTDTDIDKDSDTSKDTDTGIDAGTDIDTGTDTDTFIDIRKYTDTGIDAGTDTNRDKDTYIGINRGTGTDSDTGKDTDTGIDAGTNTDTTDTIRPRIVIEKCQEYSKLAKNKFQSTATKSEGSRIRFQTTNKNTIIVGNCEKELKDAYENIQREIAESTFVAFGVNGKEAAPKEFPHMAILGFNENPDDTVVWGCGGSLISERWILTAAHCEFMSSPDNLAHWARLGDLNLISADDNAQPKDYRIIQRVIHPCFKRPSRYNDIALFRLETDVEFSEYVRPICLNSEPMSDPLYMIAPGWGRTAMGELMSNTLLSVHIATVKPAVCNASYARDRTLKFGIMEDRMICAGSENGKEIQDTCQGDSGGPLQLQLDNEKSRVYMQYGITSFGRYCGDRDTPGVYTRVSKYITWIESIVWEYY